jgi:hypothetical protein
MHCAGLGGLLISGTSISISLETGDRHQNEEEETGEEGGRMDPVEDRRRGKTEESRMKREPREGVSG